METTFDSKNKKRELHRATSADSLGLSSGDDSFVEKRGAKWGEKETNTYRINRPRGAKQGNSCSRMCFSPPSCVQGVIFEDTDTYSLWASVKLLRCTSPCSAAGGLLHP